MPAKDGFQLQDGDIELLHAVYQLRIATIDHLAALSGRSVRALWGRLLKLKTRRYLASVARFMQKQVYAIGSSGVPVLVEHGYAPRGFTDRRSVYGLRRPVLLWKPRRTGALSVLVHVVFQRARVLTTTQDRTRHSRLSWLSCCLPPTVMESAS